MQFEIKKHALVSFSITSNSTRPSDSCYFDSLWKTHSCVFSPPQFALKPYAITYTNIELLLCISKTFRARNLDRIRSTLRSFWYNYLLFLGSNIINIYAISLLHSRNYSFHLVLKSSLLESSSRYPMSKLLIIIVYLIVSNKQLEHSSSIPNSLFLSVI